ncbi:MAG: PAS domain S-box protein [Pseudomonadota bacterium]
MPDDERLREALVELQDLRNREARLLAEANALFDILTALTSVTTTSDAMATLVASTQSALKANAVGLLRVADGVLEILEASHFEFPRADVTDVNLPLFNKPRNLADVPAVEQWKVFAGAGEAPFRSLLSVPIFLGDADQKGALVALHRERAQFTKSDRQLMEQISALAGQSLKALELQSRNRLLAAVIDGSSSGFAIADARQERRPLIFVNSAFERLSGYTSEEVLGQNCRFLNDEDPASAIRTELRQTVRDNATGTFVLRNKRKDGRAFWNELSLFPVIGADGQADYLVATQTDVSDRVTAQQESETNRRRMFDALSHTDDGFLLVDASLGILFSNQRFGQILPAPGLDWATGTTFDDNLAGHVKTIPATMLAQAPDIAKMDLRAVARSAAQQELQLPDGRTLFLRVQKTEDAGFVVSATDITPLKSAERTLRGRVAAIENAPDGIAIADADGRVVYANPSLCNIFGIRSEIQLIGRSWFLRYLRDNGQDRIDAIVSALDQAGQASRVLALGAEDTDRRWHDVVLRKVDEVGVIIIVRDITEQREIQNKQFELTEQLDQARRQQILSEMAAGLAHDFNNLLSAITGSAALISGDAAVTEKLRKHADRIAAAGTQAAYLVNRLLDLGRDTGDISEFDLRLAIKSAVDLLSVNLRADVTLNKIRSDDVLPVLGSPTEVTRIVLNLLLNAQDALGDDGGTLTVGSTLFKAAADATPFLGRFDPARSYAALYVEDDGAGISPDVLGKIFDPYFSTKGARGSGLGLATVASMVLNNEGAIDVETELGRGTRFTIYWPLGAHTATRGDKFEDETPADLSGHLILIVDDEADVADVVASYLERAGAEVAVVNDPELAVESILDDPDAWSLVISDYNMGVMNGGDLVDAIAKDAPDLPVIILTALSRRLADPRLSTAAVKAVFAKPPDLRQISKAVADNARSSDERGA